ncbi:MAG: hypothetical protein D3925_06130 [Candidatus Electrothrix sp. AR5]|nr:hypothetical protein [Candidatus Electrothrix sp. AR5]
MVLFFEVLILVPSKYQEADLTPLPVGDCLLSFLRRSTDNYRMFPENSRKKKGNRSLFIVIWQLKWRLNDFFNENLPPLSLS